MDFNQLIFLTIICWSSLALLWLYIKFQRRNLPTFEQALSMHGESFENLSLIDRHKMIYESLGDNMRQEIHALSIDARTPKS